MKEKDGCAPVMKVVLRSALDMSAVKYLESVTMVRAVYWSYGAA